MKISLILLLLCLNDAHAEIHLTQPPVTQKILPQKGEAGPAAKSLRIPICRGEYEPAQLVIHAMDKPLTDVRVSASSLHGPDGAELKTDRITINPMGFIRIETPTRGWTAVLRTQGGEVPDVLLPDRPMNVAAGRRQPYYLTVRTRQDDPPGEYRGIVRVSAAGETKTELPLIVRVYDVVLPVKPHLRTAFGLTTRYRRLQGANPAENLESVMRYSKFLLSHRVTPLLYGTNDRGAAPPPTQRDDGTWDFSGTDRFLSEFVPLGLTSFYTFAGAGTPAYAAHLKEKGWHAMSFVYMYDEAHMRELPAMISQYTNMRAQVPDAPILQVGWSPTKPLEGLVNIWCPLLADADLYSLRQARERGEETWWYTWDGPWDPYPNICHIDDPGIFHRIVGWMTYAYDIQGFLYWAVDVWDTHPNREPGGRLSAAEYDANNYADWKPNTYGKTSYGNPRNGDGYLLYPGKGNVPIASLRLALTRDGFEDFDLFTEVHRLSEGEHPNQVRGRELLEFAFPIDNPLIISRTQWTRKDNALLRRREEILKIGEELRRPDDAYLRTLRERQTETADALYPLPSRKR